MTDMIRTIMQYHANAALEMMLQHTTIEELKQICGTGNSHTLLDIFATRMLGKFEPRDNPNNIRELATKLREPMVSPTELLRAAQQTISRAQKTQHDRIDYYLTTKNLIQFELEALESYKYTSNKRSNMLFNLYAFRTPTEVFRTIDGCIVGVFMSCDSSSSIKLRKQVKLRLR